MIKAYLKLFIFILLAISFFAISAPFYIANTLLGLKSGKIMAHVLKFYSNLCLLLFGVKVISNDLYDYELTESNFLIVSNHLSYLDVLIVSSLFPSYFITSLDMKHAGFLGHICKMAQCVFVNRKSRSNISNEIQDINDKLLNEANVVLFPEATSTNGEQVLPFKKSMFQAAIDTNVATLPLCLNYQNIDDESLNIFNRDKVCWYGDMSFFPHFIEFLKLDHVCVSATIGMPIENPKNEDVRSLAAKCYSFIDYHYSKISKINEHLDLSSSSQFIPKDITSTECSQNTL